MTKKKKRIFHFTIAVALLALGAFGMSRLIAGKPQLEKHRPSVPIPVVRTIVVKTGPECIHILGEGTVRPLQEINLVPQVSGKLIYVSPSLVNGGTFKEGELLLRIDPADYELAVILARAKVKDSDSKLKLAFESAAAAREEWWLLHAGGPKADTEPPPLVGKEPQLAASQAGLAASRAELRKALLHLERTELSAPFDGRVSQESVDVGQYVSPGQVLASLYSTNAAEIVIPLEDADLFWFHVPGFTPGYGRGSKATVRARIAGRDMSWQGRVVRAEGKLDERTRMINVVIRVERPYAKRPPLGVGLFVSVDIEGRTIPEATMIPRSALHRQDIVWVVDKDGRLCFRKVEIARFSGDMVIIRSGLSDGEAVVVSPIKAVTDGMNVRSAKPSEVN